MLKTQNVNPQIEKKSNSPELSLRNWIMEGGDARGLLGLTPVSTWLLENKWWSALDLAWENGANPNVRGKYGRSWLIQAILDELPFSYLSGAFRKMDNTWWMPDDFGYTPFHYPIHDPKIIPMLVNRGLIEQLNWKFLNHPFNPMEADLPQTKQLNKWKNLLN